MAIKPSEISALIKEQIKNYAHEMEQNDVGTIVSVGDGVCLIYGLDKAMYGELLEFPNDVYGLVMNLEEEHVGAVLLGDSKEAASSLSKFHDQRDWTSSTIPVPRMNDPYAANVLISRGCEIYSS